MAKRLYRNDTEKVIGGVCSGLAEYFDIDVVIVRVIFIATALVWGTSILIYLILWIAIPRKPVVPVSKSATEETPEAIGIATKQIQSESVRTNKSREILAVILIFVGLYATLDNIVYWFSGRIVLPIVLIALGLFILLFPWGKQKETKNEGAINDTP